MLTLYHQYPEWAAGPYLSDGKTSDYLAKENDTANTWRPTTQNRSEHGLNRKVPDSFALDSPWGWWISYLIARYQRGAAQNLAGPQANGNRFGNTTGAWVTRLKS